MYLIKDSVKDLITEVRVHWVSQKSPHFVHLFGIYEDHDTVTLVLEYISGGTLFESLLSNNMQEQDIKLVMF